ncbi:Deleted in malignant brain tumors 1 protein, partial [Eurypyga helias]
LRLSDGPHRCAGRVEVFYENLWGTVCDDHWDLEDAGVVCRQLGCGSALSAPGAGHFRAGSGPIWLDDVNCTGMEVALSHCRTKGWGKNNCHHGEDASVVCSGNAPWKIWGGEGSLACGADTPTDTPARLRLENGLSRCAGRVEVFHHHQWGTVCDDGWSLAEAAVVCRQLGCGTAVSAPGSAHFGQGSGRIWLDNVNCTGMEATLSECQARPWGSNSCDHRKDASVVCSGWGVGSAQLHPRQPGIGALTPPWFTKTKSNPETDLTGTVGDVFPCVSAGLRLVNGSNNCLGRVEVFHDHKWGTVCDDTWDIQDAAVVCRQLGCGMVLSAPGSAHFGPGSDPIWLDGIHCTGTESALSKCELGNWGEHNCGHSEDAGVVCSGNIRDRRGGWGGTVTGCPEKLWMPHPWKFAESPGILIRLVGSPSHCAGRVEVLHNGTWGTVCDDGWGSPEGQVVCRQLGCGTVLSVAPEARYGQGTGQIWLDEVNCTGEERDLSECQARPWGVHNCHHVEDASVEC